MLTVTNQRVRRGEPRRAGRDPAVGRVRTNGRLLTRTAARIQRRVRVSPLRARAAPRAPPRVGRLRPRGPQPAATVARRARTTAGTTSAPSATPRRLRARRRRERDRLARRDWSPATAALEVGARRRRRGGGGAVAGGGPGGGLQPGPAAGARADLGGRARHPASRSYGAASGRGGERADDCDDRRRLRQRERATAATGSSGHPASAAARSGSPGLHGRGRRVWRGPFLCGPPLRLPIVTVAWLTITPPRSRRGRRGRRATVSRRRGRGSARAPPADLPALSRPAARARRRLRA